MRNLFVIIIALVALSVSGAEMQKVEITSFAPGLVTAKGYVGRTMGEAFKNHNTDMTRFPGDLSVRLGYGAMVTIPGIDSILHNGLYPATYQNGNRQLIAVADWADSAFAGIFASGINEIDFGYIDSLTMYADTSVALDTMRNTGDSLIEIAVYITAGGNKYESYKRFDSTTGPGEIVDTFVARINASDVSTYVTASKVGTDSLMIAEGTRDYAMYFKGHYTKYHSIKYGQENFWNPVDTVQVSLAMTSQGVRFPATSSPRYAQYRGDLYMVNGVSRGVVVTPSGTSEFPLRAPGTIMSLPLKTNGTLDGEYRYAVQWTERIIEWGVGDDSSVVQGIGALSSPSRVYDGQMMLYGFPTRPRDTIHGYTDSLATSPGFQDTTATIYLRIYRTAGNKAGLRLVDTLFLVDSVSALNKHSAWDILDYTDTVSDSTLRTRPYVLFNDNPMDSTWLPDTLDQSSPSAMPFRFMTRPGAPSAWDMDSCSDAEHWGSGMWQVDTDDSTAHLEWEDVGGFAWTVLFRDTLTGMASDTGRSLVLLQKKRPVAYTVSYDGFGGATGFARSRSEKMTIIMPETDLPDVECVLYRCPLEVIEVDTLSRPMSYSPLDNRKRWLSIAKEFSIGGVYYIGTYEPGEKVTDSLPYDELMVRVEYRKNTIPPLLSDIATIGNRLMGADDGNVYMSSPTDSAVFFNILEQRPVSPDGGDPITRIWEQTQGVLKVALNKSLFQLIQSSGLWLTPELSAHYGCVAPLSLAKAPEGDYFLSLDGVRLEDENRYRARSFEPTLASSPLNNFTQQPASILKTAIATYWDNKYILSIPELDTSYVLGKVINVDGSINYVWHTWDLLISASAQFNSTDNSTGLSGDSLWFTMPGDSVIYIYGTQTDDNGTFIDWVWWSGPTNQIDGYMRYVEDASFFIQSNDSVTYSTQCRFYGDDGLAWGTETIWFNPLDSTKYHHFGQVGSKGGLYYQLYLTGSSLYLPGTDDGSDWYTQIEAIWLTLSKREHYGSQ